MIASSERGEMKDSPKDASREFICLDRVYKVHRVGDTGVAALAGVTLSIPHRGLIAVMGPSGSGKSTLLNLMGGLDRPSAGTVQVGGTDLSLLPEAKLSEYRRRTVGFLWQGSARNLLPYLTAEQNVLLPLLLVGRRPALRRRRVQELLELLGLSDRRSYFPAQLSGGEQQRTALAVALANAPPVVLADEPTAELDVATGESVVQALLSIRATFGTTVVIATHDAAVASRSDSTYHLLDGRVRSRVGTATLSSMSLTLPGEAAELLRGGDELVVHIEAGDLRISPILAEASGPIATQDQLLQHSNRPRLDNAPTVRRDRGRSVLLTAREVSHSYRTGATEVPVLRSVSLSLSTGEFIVVMGPSGSGKTTLLAILAGFEEPQQGEVASQALSDELAASQTGLHGAHIGIVFQSLGLLPSLTAEENVVLPLLHAGMKLQRASGRAGEWLNRLGLGERKRHRVNELSLGQQQRVAVARALATEPRIVLADEPTAEVDEKAASIIVDALHEVTDRGGGVIVASHDTRLSATADRVLLLRGGRLAASA